MVVAGVPLALDLGFGFYESLDPDLGFVLCAPWPVRCVGLYSMARVLDGAVALIADVEI
jgi:hypothetical protein